MPDRATDLAQSLKDAEAAVKELGQKVDVTEATSRRAKFASAAAVFASAAALIGFVAVLVLIGRVNANQEHISDLQTAQQESTERNRRGQCAMNQLFLQFEPRTTTNPTYSAEQRALQLEAYKTLRQISHDLGCPEGR